MIRRLLLAAAAVLLTTHLFASDVYVAPPPVGLDSNPGSQAAPFATISKALSATVSGDRIFLRSDGTWRGTFTLSGNRQLLPEPGTGAAPTLTASTIASGPWTTSGTIVSTPVAQQVLDVWVNGTFMHMARYPNTGYLRVRNGTTATHMICNELPARPVGHWNGAQVRWRRWSWWWETRTISSDSGGTTLDLPATGIIPSITGVGGNSPDGLESCFYIDNALSELDAPGEWFWGGGTLSLIPPTGVDPATMVVEIVTSTAGITCSGGTIQGIAFRGFDATALSVTGPSTIDRCTFDEIGDTAVNCTWGSSPTFVRNSTFRNVRNIAIYLNQNPNGASGTFLERNLLQHIGTDRGYGGSGPWHAAGIILGNAKNSITRFNRIIDTGYCGVIVGHAGQIIDRNILVRTMSTLNDGGAIYTNCSSTTITQNIVLDTIGELETSMPWWPLGQGIWPEFLSDFHNQTITDNTVYGCSCYGVFMQNEYNCLIERNVLADNRRAGLFLSYIVDNSTTLNDYGVAENTDDDLRPQGHIITANTIANGAPNRRLVRPEHLNKWYLPPYTPPQSCLVLSDGTVNYGTMDHSTFIVSPTGVDLFDAQNPTRFWNTMADWAAGNTPWAQPGDSLVHGSTHLLINDTETTSSIRVPAGTWTLPSGSAVGTSVTVAPFRSAVLMTTGTLPSTPYTMASWLDWRSDTPTTHILGEDPHPTPGLASSPTSATAAPIPVSFSGATTPTAGLKRIELWYDLSDVSPWINSGLTTAALSGTFLFQPPGSATGTYHFALVAVGNDDVRSAAPVWPGDCATLFDATPPTVAAIDVLTTSPMTTQVFVVRFSEPVTGFDSPGDVTIVHNPVGTTAHTSVTIAPLSATQYVVTVLGLSGAGSFTFAVPAGACVDEVGWPNGSAGPVTVDYPHVPAGKSVQLRIF